MPAMTEGFEVADGRTGVYRGATREAAEREYHAAAKAQAEEGYVPATEQWSVELGEQVLTVGYVHAPEQVESVLAALSDMPETSPPASLLECWNCGTPYPTSAPTCPTCGKARPQASPITVTVGPTGPASTRAWASLLGSRRNWIVAGVVMVLLLLAAWQTGLIARLTSPAGPAGNVPPAGQIWFGSSFDPTTFSVTSQTATAKVGSNVAMVAQLSHPISSGQGELRVSLNGNTVQNQSLPVRGSGQLAGAMVTPYSLPGSYFYEITDSGGNVLASGTLFVTP